MNKTKTFSEYLVEKEYFSQEEFDALNENLKTELTEEEEAKVDDAEAAKEDYAAKMKKKGATLPKGFIKDAKANTGH